MTSVGQEARVLNFVVIGEVRSGLSVVQSSINNRGGAICHAELFHPDVVVRQAAHEAYFGACPDPEKMKVPEWFVEGETNPWQYISHTIFDNPKLDETATGFCLTYPEIRRWELYDLFETRYREGDFCLIHVLRNPVACFISLQQAKQSNIWSCNSGDMLRSTPSPVSLDQAELIEFCRAHQATRTKIRACCQDTVEISYQDLYVYYQRVMRTVFDFLELPDSEQPAFASYRRLRNRSITDRVINIEQLRRTAPSDVRELLNSEDLF